MSNLYNIERLSNQSRTKAWEELQKISPDKLSRKEIALYNLLLVKTQTVNNSLSLTDSLLNISIAYYQDTKDSARLSQAYYYKGNIFRQKKYYIQAMECYQNAEKYAANSGG